MFSWTLLLLVALFLRNGVSHAANLQEYRNGGYWAGYAHVGDISPGKEITIGQKFSATVTQDSYFGSYRIRCDLQLLRGEWVGNDPANRIPAISAPITAPYCGDGKRRQEWEASPNKFVPGHIYTIQADGLWDSLGSGGSGWQQTLIKVKPLSGSVNQGSATVAYDIKTFRVTGKVGDGATELSVWRGNQGLQNFAGPAVSGDLDISALPPGQSWRLDFYAALPYAGGTHWQWIKAITIQREAASVADTEVTLTKRMPVTSDQQEQTLEGMATSTDKVWEVASQWRTATDNAWQGWQQSLVPTPDRNVALSRKERFPRVNGHYGIELCARTQAGKWGCSVDYVELNFDPPAPTTIGLNQRLPSYSNKREQTLSGLATSTQDVTRTASFWRKDGSANQGRVETNVARPAKEIYVSRTEELPAADGKYWIGLCGKAGKGPESCEEDWVTLDTTAPELSWDTPLADSFGDASLRGTVRDTASGPGDDGNGRRAITARYWNPATESPANAKTTECDAVEGEFDCKLPLDGRWEGQRISVALSAVDRVGNSSPLSRVRTFTVDTLAPSIAWISPADGASFMDTIPVVGQVGDANPKQGLVQWRLPSTQSWQGSGPLEVDAQGLFRYSITGVAVGQHVEVRLSGVDQADHDSGHSAVRTFQGALGREALDLGLGLANEPGDGYVPGAALTYQVTLSAPQGKLNAAQLDYVLVAGLQLDADKRPSLAPGSAPAALNSRWNGTDADTRRQLLGADVTVEKGQRIILNIPVRLREDVVPSRLTSTVNARAANVTGAQVARHSVEIITGRPPPAGKLKLEKAVDKKEVKPGERLTYTLRFTNLSTEGLSNLHIEDAVPPYTRFIQARCGDDILDNLGCTVVPPTGTSESVPGVVRWRFKGILPQAVSGTVTYSVEINR